MPGSRRRMLPAREQRAYKHSGEEDELDVLAARRRVGLE